MPCEPAARLTVKLDATACRTLLSGFDGKDGRVDGNETGNDGSVGFEELFDEEPPQAASTTAAAATPTTNALEDRIAPPSSGVDRSRPVRRMCQRALSTARTATTIKTAAAPPWKTRKPRPTS